MKLALCPEITEGRVCQKTDDFRGSMVVMDSDAEQRGSDQVDEADSSRLYIPRRRIRVGVMSAQQVQVPRAGQGLDLCRNGDPCSAAEVPGVSVSLSLDPGTGAKAQKASKH